MKSLSDLCRFLSEAEDCKVVVEESSHLHISDFLLVGNVMTHKDYNEASMARMIDLWSPKVRVSIQPLCGDRFLFVFPSTKDRYCMMDGGRGTSKKYLCF